MAHGSRRMVSGFGRIVCAIAAMLLSAVAVAQAGPTKAQAAPTNVLTDSDCLSRDNLKASAKSQAKPVSLYVRADRAGLNLGEEQFSQVALT